METLCRLVRRLEPPFQMRYLGFGLIYAWSSIVFDTSAAASPWAKDLFGESPVHLVSTLVTPLFFLIAAIACRKDPISRFPKLFVAAPLMSSAGALCFSFEGFFDGVAGGALVLVGSLLVGVGPALLILLWMEAISARGIDAMETIVPASFIMTVATVVALPFLSWEGAVVLGLLLPMASGACLMLAWFGGDAVESGPAFDEVDLGQDVAKSSFSNCGMAAAAAAIFVAYFVVAAVCAVVELDFERSLFSMGIGSVFAIVLAFLVVMYSVHIDLDALYRVIVVPFVIALALAAYPVSRVVSSCIISAVVTGLEIIMLLYFTRLAHACGRPLSFGVSIGEFAAYGGIFLGTVAKIILGGLLDSALISCEGVALLLVCVFACSTLLVFRSGGELELSPSLHDARNFVADASRIAGESSSDKASRATFGEVCREVANEKGLSPRETEIFTMLAQGRSQPYIRDVLVLSKNTVSTHVRHIYAKLDVHSKQELLDLIESRSGFDA